MSPEQPLKTYVAMVSQDGDLQPQRGETSLSAAELLHLCAAYNEAARERDLLRASVDLALPCIRIALECAERAPQGRAARELRYAIYHLTVGTQ